MSCYLLWRQLARTVNPYFLDKKRNNFNLSSADFALGVIKVNPISMFYAFQVHSSHLMNQKLIQEEKQQKIILALLVSWIKNRSYISNQEPHNSLMVKRK